jgi:uncharacterized protein (DUF1697 family)
MKFLCLIRGINVGGNNTVSMKQLNEVLTNHGYENVVTYINSGNVIFDSNKVKESITKEVESLIELFFNVQSRVLILSKDDFFNVVNEIPAHFTNNDSFKTDVLFFIDNAKELASKLKFKDEIETYKLTDTALIYGVERKNQNKSTLLKIVGTPLYQVVTIRNVNTVRKLKELLSA